MQTILLRVSLPGNRVKFILYLFFYCSLFLTSYYILISSSFNASQYYSILLKTLKFVLNKFIPHHPRYFRYDSPFSPCVFCLFLRLPLFIIFFVHFFLTFLRSLSCSPSPLLPLLSPLHLSFVLAFLHFIAFFCFHPLIPPSSLPSAPPHNSSSSYPLLPLSSTCSLVLSSHIAPFALSLTLLLHLLSFLLQLLLIAFIKFYWYPLQVSLFFRVFSPSLSVFFSFHFLSSVSLLPRSSFSSSLTPNPSPSHLYTYKQYLQIE